MTKAKKLYRSTSDRMIAGVCGGLAEYFNVDPVVVRLVFALLLLPGGAPGILPYIILWIVVPEQLTKKPSKNVKTTKSKSKKA